MNNGSTKKVFSSSSSSSVSAKVVRSVLAVLSLSFFLQGCSSPPAENHIGDIEEIVARKVLRVIVRPEPVAFVPRGNYPAALERTIARELAAELGVELELVVAEDYAGIIDKLLDGEGDIVATGLTVTKARKRRAAFSTPYLYVDELLITRTGDDMPKGPEELKGRDVCVRKSSSYFQTLTAPGSRVPGLKIREMPELLPTEEIADLVAGGLCFATVADSNYWEAISGGYDNLSAPFALSTRRPIALAMRPGARGLKKKVNEFLISRALTGGYEALHADDLNGLKSRKVLRMLTRNNAMTYYIYRGTQVGFEYELVRRFAEEHDLRLDVVIPPGHEDLIPWLNQGRGDIVAAALTITPERAERAAFTEPYNEVREVVVVREDYGEVAASEDLVGKVVYVRESSSFYETLVDLREVVPGFEIALLPEDLETEEILKGVEEGEWDITVSDSNLLEVERSYGRKLRAAFELKDTELGWAVRRENEGLLEALNAYIAREQKQGTVRIMKGKYFENRRTIRRAHQKFRSDTSGRISPYDDLAKKYADRYGLDWRLVSAQIYRESGFDPNTVSWAGAVGLMQLMPETARELGVSDVYEPEQSIRAGTKYMSRLIRRIDGDVALEDRLLFALAAYNVGYSHLTDARRLAARKGWSPDRWFGSVERAMLLLEKPEYYRKARYGYCRGSEPVAYVRDVQELYDAYVEHVPQ
ncbi:MAG: membrane-bound lytic murein transglycosylase MltF [Thermodesulfobacteriota bacterium]